MLSHVRFLQPNELEPTRLLCSCDPPGKNTGLPFPSPGYLPDPGIKAASLKSTALVGGFFMTSTTWETLASHGGEKYLRSYKFFFFFFPLLSIEILNKLYCKEIPI